MEILIQNGVLTARRYAAGVALQTVVGGVTQSTRYLFHDHLGSLVRIVNADGSVAEALDYATFGARRTYGNPAGTGGASSYTPRGYTGHEYVDGAQVTHMNGRIYDEQLARFLQPDPVVQAPGNGQSWNAYTYVFNNPLAYTDPTGQFGILGGLALGWAMHNYVHKGLIRGAMQAIGPQATGLAVGVGCNFAGPWGILCAAGGSYDAARAFSASSKEARQAAVAGAFTAAVGYGLSVKYGGQVTYGRVAISALAGGIAAEIQGGKFGDGFVAAGLTTAVMPQVGYIDNDFGRTVVGAIIGGTISEATGGKFANGAISGAIQAAMTKGPPGAKYYAKRGGVAGEIDWSGATSEERGLLSDPATRAQGLRLLSARMGLLIQDDMIGYVDVPGPQTELGRADASFFKGRITFYKNAFDGTNTFWELNSIMEHEYSHWLDWRFNLPGSRDTDLGEANAYKYQMDSAIFNKLPASRQAHTLAMYTYFREEYRINTSGFYTCKKLEDC